MRRQFKSTCSISLPPIRIHCRKPQHIMFAMYAQRRQQSKRFCETDKNNKQTSHKSNWTETIILTVWGHVLRNPNCSQLGHNNRIRLVLTRRKMFRIESRRYSCVQGWLSVFFSNGRTRSKDLCIKLLENAYIQCVSNPPFTIVILETIRVKRMVKLKKVWKIYWTSICDKKKLLALVVTKIFEKNRKYAILFLEQPYLSRVGDGELAWK